MKLPSALIAGVLALCGCAHTAPTVPKVAEVDIPRFMGDWYVIASIPTALERGAHNAVESYQLDADGSIPTTFTFRDGGFDGKVKTYHPRGFVRDKTSNAVWGMRFIWPIKADYRIVYVSQDYERTIIGREKRDNVWIMARTPQIRDADFADLRARVIRAGYDPAKLELVPQRWPAEPKE